MAGIDIKEFLKKELKDDKSIATFLGYKVEDFDAETLLLLVRWQIREDERRC